MRLNCIWFGEGGRDILTKANENEPSAQYQKRIPIRTRILSIVLAATMISLMSASVIGIICMSWIRGSSEKALT